MLTEEEVSNQNAFLELAFQDLGSRYQGVGGDNEMQFSPEGPYPVAMAPAPTGGRAYDMAFNDPQPAKAGDLNWTYGAPGGNQQLVPRRPTSTGHEGTFSVMGGPASGGGYGQVQNLSQLKQIMGALQGVPPDLRDKLITQLTGIPFKGEKQMALESAVTQARAKHALEAPMREAEFGRKLEEGQYRREQQGETRDYRNEMQQLRREAIQNQRNSQLKMLSDTSTNLPPNHPMKAAIGQIQMKLIQRYMEELGLNEPAPMEGPPSGGGGKSPKITVRRLQ